jgi:probable H4MPT-linked C1 transfer pathway protein
MRQYYGWDIGGAHVKRAIADADGRLLSVHQFACPLWQGVERLTRTLAEALRGTSTNNVHHCVTMTGELCDVFASREDGVRTILDIAAGCMQAPLHVYAGEHGWLDITSAAARPLAVASMNWHATAARVARSVPSALCIDVGSTTTDLVPVTRGAVVARAVTDADRLTAGELIYTGACRTPVMAVCRTVPYRGDLRGIAAEYFANMADVYRVTAELPPDADLFPTADGRPADLAHSIRRIARMLGEDARDDDFEAWHGCARYIADEQFSTLRRSVARVLSREFATAPPACFVGAGAGRFLVGRLAAHYTLPCIDFATLVGADPECADAASVAAPAAALASLAAADHL